MLSFSSISETAIGQGTPANQGDVNITLPSIALTLDGSEASFTILIDYFGHLPAIDIALSGYAIAPLPDTWLRYPTVQISFDAYPVTPATGIVRTLPVITLDLAVTPPTPSTGIALTLPTISFTLDDYEFAIGGIVLSMPSITFDIDLLRLKLTPGATVDFNVLKFLATGAAIAEVAVATAGPLLVQRAPVPEFMVRVFPIVPKMGVALMMPAISMTMSADAIEAISRPRAVNLFSIPS